MAGIAGIICKEKSKDLFSLAGVTAKCMAHERASASETYVNETLGVALSWAGEKGAEQAVWNEARNICVIVAGEYFPGRTGAGDGNGADENLAQQYEKLGDKMVECLNGWFSGVLLDLRVGRVVLFNDRYGLNRIYWHENESGFFFASEAKAILKVVPALGELDWQSLGEFFSCGCVLQNRSLFSRISVLPCGSFWSFNRNGLVAKGAYFKPKSWEEQPPLADESYYERLKETFGRVLPRYLQGGEKIAMSLTGGLDGRMIMAWAQRGAGELPCYTFGSAYRKCADVKLAERVARECGQSHTIIPVGDEFLADFPALAEKTVFITDGAMDVSGAAELYVNRIGRQIAPVRLTGNYGSEILRNNVAFRPRGGADEFLDSGFAKQTGLARATYAEEARGNRRSFIAFKQVPWHHHARFCLEQSQLKARSPFLDNELVALAFQTPAGLETSVEPALRLIAEGNPRLGQIPTDRGLVYPAGKRGNKFRKAIEELLIKAEYAYDYGMPHWLAKADRIAAPLKLERLFLGRQKFCHYRIWYRRQLAPYVRQVLLDHRSLSRPFLYGRKVEAMVQGHVRGTHNFTTEIHKLLTVELLHRQLIEQR